CGIHWLRQTIQVVLPACVRQRISKHDRTE
ncbi:MAG: hypothetical protein ACI89X_003522, partial [Planctomycetota bacterium]